MTTMLLVPGGLWEDMDARRFWVRPGVVAGLRDRGCTVLAPDRLRRARTWAAEVDHLASGLPDGPVVVVAGSNGCSVAALLAVTRPESVRALVLAWPATAGDSRVDGWHREQMLAHGADPGTVDGLLAGGTLRGVSDADLAAVTAPVGVVPTTSGGGIDNPFHQGHTVDALLALVPGATRLPGCPEPPRPEFPAHLDAFLSTVTGFTAATAQAGPAQAGPAHTRPDS